MEQILLANGLPKETMLYKTMKVMVPSLDGNAKFFHIIAGVLQSDVLALYVFIICLDYIPQM